MTPGGAWQTYGLLLLVHEQAAYYALFIIFPVARQVPIIIRP